MQLRLITSINRTGAKSLMQRLYFFMRLIMITQHKRFEVVKDILEDTRKLLSNPINWKRGSFTRTNAWSIDTGIEKSRNDNNYYQNASLDDQAYICSGINAVINSTFKTDRFDRESIGEKLRVKLRKQRVYRSYNKRTRFENSLKSDHYRLVLHCEIVAWNDYSTHDEVIILLDVFIEETKDYLEYDNEMHKQMYHRSSIREEIPTYIIPEKGI